LRHYTLNGKKLHFLKSRCAIFSPAALYKGKIDFMQKDLHRLMRDPRLLPSEKQDLLTRIAAQSAAMNMSCYLVGGPVRDLLLEKPVNDSDIVVEGDAIKLGNALLKKYGGKLTVHQKFGTAIWFYNETDALDLITARSETYEAPGALPTINPSTIEEDLHRRDFSINAMAIRLDGEHFGQLLDPVNGQAELEKRLIRVLHPRSFADDPTRIFRAVRYEQRYEFKIEPDTLKLIDQESLDVLSKLSGERVRHELDLILEEESSARMLSRAGELGLFNAFSPRLPMLNPKYAGLFDSEPPDEFGMPHGRVLLGYLLWLMDCTVEQPGPIAKRFDFTAELQGAVMAAVRLKNEIPRLANSRPSVWTARLDKTPLMAIHAVWLVTNEPALKEFNMKWRHIKPQTTGDTLKAMGIPPGPRYREILSRLRAAWLDGEVKDAKEEAVLLKVFTSSSS
jgi:tRNA nucleotidyltransferase (CCA-adding enzyme)